jgi:hypothetical protein
MKEQIAYAVGFGQQLSSLKTLFDLEVKVILFSLSVSHSSSWESTFFQIVEIVRT